MPAVLVIVSVAAFLAGDPAVRERIVGLIGEQVPPLAPLFDEALGAASGLAATTGILGLAVLAWSASSFVRVLDGAFRVVFWDDGAGRTPLRDVVAVAGVAAGMVAAAAVLVLATLPDRFVTELGVPLGWVRAIVAAVPAVLLVALVGLAYWLVPRPRPGLRALAVPAVTVGLAVFLLTSLFSFLGPLLLGSAQLYGAFGALFLGLIWLGYVTEVLLIGAAWVAERDRRNRAAAAVHGEAPGL